MVTRKISLCTIRQSAFVSAMNNDPLSMEFDPATSPERDRTAFEILRAIRRIVRRIAEHSRQLGREVGLTVSQLLCLKAIAEGQDAGEVTVVMVANSVQLSAATVSRILDQLEQACLIVRHRESTDRRKVCLSLTERGRARLERLPAPLQERFLDRLQQLDHTRRLQLLHALEQIVEMMEAADIEAAPLLASEPPAGP
jgi:DNA-binding MarR family transcriptional regulator